MYHVSSATCRNSSLHFLSAWSQRLQASGYVSGVYASGSSGIRILDQARARGTRLSLPQQVWVADWNGYANTRSSHLRSGGWIKSRVKQYRGDHTERHGGVRINIDSNFVDLSIGQVQSSSHRAARHTTKHAVKRHAKHQTKHHARPQTRRHAKHQTRRHAKHQSRHNRWSYLPGGSTPEVELPVTDRLCTTHRINLASYPSTGVFRRTRLHARLQCVLKQNGLFEHRVDGYWGRRMAHGVHRLQSRADRLVRSTMTRGDWVALLVSGHHRSWLVRGVRGADVVRLQRALHAAGVRGVYISGRYDRATARAVRTYQHRVGIRATGTVGMRTWRYLGRGRH